jgi:diguanylate cyclase (GGDEF)-like protein
MTIVLLVGLSVALVAALLSLARSRTLRVQLTAECLEARGRIRSLERDTGLLRREAQQIRDEHQFLSRFLQELPHLTRELHSGLSARRIPSVILNIVKRSLEPEQAIVLLRRRRALTDEGRTDQLIVTAADPPTGVKIGTEVTIGQGELGFVAEMQRVMSRQDFDGLTSVNRQQLQAANLPGFDPDLAAPMVFSEDTVGLIAVSRPHQTSSDAKALLRLVAQIGALAVHNAATFFEMKVTADMDGLTHVFNKRHMTRFLAEQIYQSEQEVSSMAIFLFDIDHFKNYNDLHGHVAGDKLLQVLASLVKENVRKDDVFGRFGGEEFLLVLPRTNSAQAVAVAEKVRSMIAAHPFLNAADQPLGRLSISGGVASFPVDARDSTGLLAAADKALYAAKRQGRNRVLPVMPRYLSVGEADSVVDQDFVTGDRTSAD